MMAVIYFSTYCQGGGEKGLNRMSDMMLFSTKVLKEKINLVVEFG